MLNHKAILIIDDEFIILESLRIQISRILPDDIILEAASSGEESLQLIDEFHQENKELVLVISDFHLDDYKGTDVLRHAADKFPDAKRVILTGQADKDLLEQFNQEVGLTASLNKPWDFYDIKNIIHSVLGLS